jgi:hypothetical protein
MIITPFSNKHGYYQLDNKITYSKLEAVEWQKLTGKWPEWNFNKEIFDSYDWTTMPDHDLAGHYKTRARQIREQYDYCVLFYSGGSDSHNMLNAWIEEDLKIDEIASFWNLEATKDPQSFMCAEIQNVVLPDIDTLHKKGLEFEFRLIDICQLTTDYIAKHRFDYGYYSNHAISPNNVVKGMFRETIPEYKKLIDQGKKVCFVWGSEKPQMHIDKDGSWYFQFMDVIDNCISPYVQMNQHKGWFDELFYWSPDMPQLLIKQAHVIKNFCDISNDVTYFQNNSSPYGYSKKLNMYISHDGVKRILYPWWDQNIFCNGKGAVNYLTYSPRDSWIMDSSSEMITSIVDAIPDYWKMENPKSSAVKAHIQRHKICN